MKLNKSNLEELCKVGREAALEAGMYIQSQFDKHYVKQNKVGGDSLASQVVTEVDIKAQEIIIDHLSGSIQKYDIGLLTEEAEDDNSRAIKDYFWCIDPMDGTLPFTERRTGYAVSIALISKLGNPVVAVVYIPDLKECYSAVKDQGVALNNKPYTRDTKSKGDVIDVYWDISFKSESYYRFVVDKLTEYTSRNNLNKEIHLKYGGVRNAIGVMQSGCSCYFKFPKKKKGCGSIWDYAATRLFFEELGLYVSDSNGSVMHLNNLKTTFMNDCGILYATDEGLSKNIIEIGNSLKRLIG